MDFLTFSIGLLLVLAVVDLSVGVSNDAVNFLNSAIGSRVATRRTILIVASCGIVLGAMFSSGIMEVARSGIFNPEMFTFADLMVVFLAVMIADILLLDLFNTFGLPTSTTVSIVFELLGAATAVALLISLGDSSSPSFLSYINGRNALTIIAGIVLSVGIAFVVGAVVQFVSRLLFTFDLNRRVALRVGWSAIALTVISYFMLIKGVRGTALFPAHWQEFVTAHTLPLLSAILVAWALVAAAIDRLGRDPLAFVVLAGTFSLAMAFASNDLVNFIGVPLAAWESWRAWLQSGVAADTFAMDMLREPVRGANGYLLIAVLIMAATLWLSSKARSVTQTEVKLARQRAGTERFRPGPVSRRLVHVSLVCGEGLRLLTPPPWRTDIARRFRNPFESRGAADGPAFDLLRASVNLAVASILIAFATSLKLPLSTTFVTFMVAMGTSLADRAWGRDSAAYRVAGVLAVLSGWFATAAVAFVLAAVFAVVLYSYGFAGLLTLCLLVAFALYRTFRYHGSRLQHEARGRAAVSGHFGDPVQLLQKQMAELLEAGAETLDLALQGRIECDGRRVKRAHRAIGGLSALCVSKELSFVRLMKQDRPVGDVAVGPHLEALACQQDFYQSVRMVVEIARSHVLNSHDPLTAAARERLGEINRSLKESVDTKVLAWAGNARDAEVSSGLDRLNALIDAFTHCMVEDLYAEERPVKYTTLQLTLAAELSDIVRELQRARVLWSGFFAEAAAARPQAPDSPASPQPAG